MMLRTREQRGVLDGMKRFYELQSRNGEKKVMEHVIRLLLQTPISLYSFLVEFGGYFSSFVFSSYPYYRKVYLLCIFTVGQIIPLSVLK
jgi:predicted component of type VI protein secretion system